MPFDIDATLQSISRDPSPDSRFTRLRDLAAKHPRIAVAWLRLAQAAVGVRQFATGLEALDRALCLDVQSVDAIPGLPAFLVQRIQALKYVAEMSRAGDHEAEVAALRRLLDRFPDHTSLLFNLAVQLFRDDPDEAVRIARQAIALSPTIESAFPETLRSALTSAQKPAGDDPIVGKTFDNYRAFGIRTRSSEHVLYDGLRLADGEPVTLRRHLERLPEAALRLFREQKDAPPIEHPSIVRVLDAVVGPDGGPLQVLERINGRTVWEAFDRRSGDRRDLDDGLDIAWLAARVLEDLHDRNALHGKIGPDCVLVDAGNIARPILIIDNGLEMRRRRGGSLPIGNSPDLQATPASDIYGFGVLLHYLMTGELPSGDHVDDNLLPPDASGRIVQELLRRCLDRDPRKRYRAKQLAGQLQLLWFAEPTSLSVGKVVDDWHLVGRLGEGTFAEVFRAEHAFQPARAAAVKVLRLPHARDREARFRFEREATRTPVHPGIVRIEPRMFCPASSAPYFAMELLHGCSLHNLVAVPQPLTTVVAWGIEIGEALAFAHERNVVHRDVKPANVFVLDPDAAGRRHVKLLDFGIARLPDSALVTVSSATLGTYGYMPPEQFNSPSVDGLADVYALGVMLLECALGEHPAPRFDGKGWERAWWENYHKTQDVVTASARGRLNNSRAGAALCELLQRMTARLPSERPTMVEVCSALRAISDQLASASTSPTVLAGAVDVPAAEPIEPRASQPRPAGLDHDLAASELAAGAGAPRPSDVGAELGGRTRRTSTRGIVIVTAAIAAVVAFAAGLLVGRGPSPGSVGGVASLPVAKGAEPPPSPPLPPAPDDAPSRVQLAIGDPAARAAQLEEARKRFDATDSDLATAIAAPARDDIAAGHVQELVTHLDRALAALETVTANAEAAARAASEAAGPSPAPAVLALVTEADRRAQEARAIATTAKQTTKERTAQARTYIQDLARRRKLRDQVADDEAHDPDGFIGMADVDMAAGNLDDAEQYLDRAKRLLRSSGGKTANLDYSYARLWDQRARRASDRAIRRERLRQADAYYERFMSAGAGPRAQSVKDRRAEIADELRRLDAQ